MKRLLFSKIKLLSETPAILTHSSSSCSSFHSRLCKDFKSIAAEKYPKQPQLSQIQYFSSTSTSTSSWGSHHYLSEKISYFMANPDFVRQLFWNAHLKVQSKFLFDHWVKFLQVQSRGRLFNQTSFNFNSSRSRRSWFPKADDIILGLILANASVFMLWRIADPTFMRKHFMISVENFTSGRIHTLITSAFSHQDIGHICSNMIGLYFFGQSIGRQFGPEFLLKLYLAGALTGSIFFLVHHAFMSPSQSSGMWRIDPKSIPGLGASGAVNAIMLLDIFLNPKATLYFDFIIPIPAILLGIFLVGKDMLRMIEGDREISGSAHLGGAVVAALAWARIKKRWI